VSLFLEAAAARSGAAAAVLADDEGLLVGGAGGGCDLERLAALGAACARRGAAPVPAGPPGEDFPGGEDLYASQVTIGASTCTLASLGARLRRQRDLATGLSRILLP
jgi:hypothetical protein